MENKKIFIQIILIFLLASFFSTAAYSAPSLSLIYVIQQGDTLSEIASDYNIGIEELKRVNDISNSKDIKMGDELEIPLNKKKIDANKEQELFSRYNSKKEDLSFSINTHYAARINPGQQLPDIDEIPKDKI